MSTGYYELDNTLDVLFKKYEYGIVDSEEFKEYFASLDYLAKSKMLLLMAYEIQDEELSEVIFNKFISVYNSVLEDPGSYNPEDKEFCGNMSMAICLARQCLVPSDVKDLFVLANESSDPKAYITRAVKSLIECFRDLEKITEENFGDNIIMRSIYDYETDCLYIKLLSYTKYKTPSEGRVLNHPIVFADSDDRVTDVLISELCSAYKKDIAYILEKKRLSEMNIMFL